jgi:hypothetical protein
MTAIRIINSRRHRRRLPRRCDAALVGRTKLADPAVRRKLVEGGTAAVTASDEPMIVLARKLDPMRWQSVNRMEDSVTSVMQRASGRSGGAGVRRQH